ncbi:MAG: DUF4446 family protein, partial [Firmicutes bacterium]|nr:DUF4446 family protein [Bacillota bacterium]
GGSGGGPAEAAGAPGGGAGGDGLVLTGLWGRDEVRVYAKPVEGAQSRYALSEEERAAIDLAMRDRRQASP